MVHSLRGLLKVGFFRIIDVDKFLWVPVDHREPGALNLHHQPVSLLERVEDVVENIFHLRDLIWNERLGL